MAKVDHSDTDHTGWKREDGFQSWTLVLVGSGLFSRLQPGSVLDEFAQSLNEPRCRCAVDDVVVERHREVQQLAGRDLAVDHSRRPADAPDGHL